MRPRPTFPNYNWIVTYTADELTWILEQKGYSIGTVKNVYVAEFTPMGNVSKVTFEGSRDSVTVKGETCRTIFYSSTYNKSVKSQRFTINGAGAASGGIYINDSNTVLRSLEGRQRSRRQRKNRQAGRQRVCSVRLRNVHGG